MGIYERDYYRREGPSFLGSIAERGRVCKWLILINIVVFIVQLATLSRGPDGVFRNNYGPFTRALDLDPEAVMRGEVWRLVTCAFLHSVSPWHILCNLLVLWWAGSAVEEIYGSKEFLALYLASAVLASAAYVATELAMPIPGRALGASGAVSAIAVIFACHYPQRIVLLMMILPMPVWLLVVLFVAQDLIRFVSGNTEGIAVAAHLGGALFGFLYWKGQWRLTNLLPRLRGWGRRRNRPRLRIYREEEPTPPAPVAVAAPVEPDLDEHLEAKLDAVLERMSQVGKENLTESERQILLRASEIYRRRRS